MVSTVIMDILLVVFLSLMGVGSLLSGRWYMVVVWLVFVLAGLALYSALVLGV